MSEANESLLSARQGEGLAEGQLRRREATVGRKPMAKRWPDEQESHRRHGRWMSPDTSGLSPILVRKAAMYMRQA